MKNDLWPPQQEIFDKVTSNPEYGKLHEQTIGLPQTDLIQSEIYGAEKRFQSPYGMKSSFKKAFHYLGDIAIHPVTIEVEGKVMRYDPPAAVKVSKNVLRQYNCLNYGCSKCCKKTRYWNIFSEKQYQENIAAYKDELYNGEMKTILVNGEEKQFYVEQHTDTFCNHLDFEGEFCRIHELNPIHCALPLTKFKRSKNITYVTKEYFGRNWNMRCPAEFKPMDKDGFDGMIYMMNRIKSFAEEMNIETHIDKIIYDITEMYDSFSETPNELPFD
jgi:Fe-S-cluster containining protein